MNWRQEHAQKYCGKRIWSKLIADSTQENPRYVEVCNRLKDHSGECDSSMKAGQQ